MKKRLYTVPAVKVVRLKTVMNLMTTSSVSIGSAYDGSATIEDKEDDSFGW